MDLLSGLHSIFITGFYGDLRMFLFGVILVLRELLYIHISFSPPESSLPVPGRLMERMLREVRAFTKVTQLQSVVMGF